MYHDYKDLLSAFRSHGVKYPRFTKNMDLFIKADPENAKATYAALAGFGAPASILMLHGKGALKSWLIPRPA